MKMLGRIALVVAILACVVALIFANKLGGIRDGLVQDKAQLTTERDKLTVDLNSTRGELTLTKSTLASTRDELTATKGDLDGTRVKLAEASKNLETTKQSLDERTRDLDQAKTDLTAAQDSLNKIKEVTDSDDWKNFKDIKEKVVVQGEENKILGQQMVAMRQENNVMAARIKELTTTPINLRGTVAAANDKWGFVVIDVGRNYRVQTNTDFLVFRDTKLVSKVEVRSVGPTTSVAEVLPEYAKSTPRVGDLVVH